MSKSGSLIPSGVLITGASSGIGEYLARQYAAPGIRLALTGRNAERLEAVAEICRTKGAAVECHTTPVTDAGAMRALILDFAARGRLDLVLANAGISGGFKDWGGFDAHVREVAAVNIDGVFNTVNPAIEAMLGQEASPLLGQNRMPLRGQIGVVASLASFLPLPGAAIYSASKAFARVYAEALRSQLAPKGIGISSICPGFVVSRMTAKNRFPMPFLMETEPAARRIAQGLAENRARIAFPWPMLAVMRLLESLPYPLTSWLLSRAPAKE
ncbi:SDR family oxidoreductase [Ferrovibrio sp.]|uniref:SDR family NAD(P)-dependent oxidoreductase n=1 Tax=Ferrovibrio sp. TaxID=1917215 RepID=UPI0025C67A51|nr:SDR family NAD(P)-dependent oxidoreductase [Ferrovibrio sp.]MBX3455864.1 SDR family NAD(P)-dependent oxidoreductase [Ferrovibrio sp.]